MSFLTKAKMWAYFPSKSEWDETDGTTRINWSARLLIDALDRHETPMTDRTRIALSILKRAIREENKVD